MLEGADDHVIVKRHMLLRPGTQRRVSFRATPDGRLTVHAFTKKGPGLGDSEDPIDDGPTITTAPVLEEVGITLTPLLGQNGSGSGPPRPADHLLSALGAPSLADAAATFETVIGGTLAGSDEPPGVAEARPLPPGIRGVSVINPGGGIIVIDEPPRPPDIPPPPQAPGAGTVGPRHWVHRGRGHPTEAQ